MSARLKERYQKEIGPAIAKEFGIENPMAVPRLRKIVLNMGMGEAVANAKVLDTALDELKAIHVRHVHVGDDEREWVACIMRGGQLCQAARTRFC